MPESLQEISLQNVCQNLHLNSQLVKIKKWKISSSISHWIYSNYLEKNDYLQENDLAFFYLPSVQLTSLQLNWKFNDFPQFFSKISIENLKEIQLTIKNEKSFDCMKNLFKRNLTVEIQKINFFSYFVEDSEREFLKNFQLISNCFSNSLTQLKIHFERNSIFFNVPIYFEGFVNSLKKCRHLQIFHLIMYDPCCLDSTELNNLPFSSTLKELYIKCCGEPFQPFDTFLKQFLCLKTVSILLANNFRDSEIDVRIFDALSSSKETLETLDIEVPIDYIQYFDFLSNYQKLKSFHFNSYNSFFSMLKRERVLELLNRKECSILSFTHFSNSPKILDEIIISLKNHPRFFHQIVVFYFVEKDFYGKDLEEKFIKLSKYSKKTPTVYLTLNDDYNDNITELMKSCKSVNFFLNLFFCRDDSLIKLEGFQSIMKDVHLRTGEREEAGVFLGKCCKLQSFRYGCLMGEKHLKDICSGLLNSSETLQCIEILVKRQGVENNESLLTLFQNCKHLKIIIIRLYLVDERLLKEFHSFSSKLTILQFNSSIKYLNEVFNLATKLERIQKFSVELSDGRLGEENMDKLFMIFPNHQTSFFENTFQASEDLA